MVTISYDSDADLRFIVESRGDIANDFLHIHFHGVNARRYALEMLDYGLFLLQLTSQLIVFLLHFGRT